LHDRNTLHSAIAAYWRLPSNLKQHWKLIDLFEQRSRYDSVVHHLDLIANDAAHPADQRKAAVRVSDLELRVQGRMKPMEILIASLGAHGQDSALKFSLLTELGSFYEKMKKPDSVHAIFKRIFGLI